MVAACRGSDPALVQPVRPPACSRPPACLPVNRLADAADSHRGHPAVPHPSFDLSARQAHCDIGARAVLYLSLSVAPSLSLSLSLSLSRSLSLCWLSLSWLSPSQADRAYEARLLEERLHHQRHAVVQRLGLAIDRHLSVNGTPVDSLLSAFESFDRDGACRGGSWGTPPIPSALQRSILQLRSPVRFGHDMRPTSSADHHVQRSAPNSPEATPTAPL